MTLDAPPPARDLEALLDALLYAVSHDLRSPLLALSLAAELLAPDRPDPADDPADAAHEARQAHGALQAAAADLERMLHALTLLSRARRRVLVVGTVPLRMVAGPLPEGAQGGVPDLAEALVAADPVALSEALEALLPDGVTGVALEDASAVLSGARPAALDEADGSPLLALAGSLQRYAGTPLEALAAAEVVVERSGGAVRLAGDALRVTLPLARPVDGPATSRPGAGTSPP